MGKVSFKSQEVSVASSKESIFEFISDLRNFESLMPDQVEKWEADRDQCEFTIKGLSTFNMKIAGRSDEKVVLMSGDKAPIDFELTCYLKSVESNAAAMLELNADLPPMIKMMASRPLQNLVDIMAEKLKDHFSA